jgi:hypothetical protein
LETIFEGLSNASADTMIAVADHLMDVALSERRRWWGLGGDVPLLNLKGIKLLGRILRLSRRRQANAHERFQAGAEAAAG